MSTTCQAEAVGNLSSLGMLLHGAIVTVFPWDLFLLQHLQGHSRAGERCSTSEEQMLREAVPVRSSLNLWEQKMEHFSVLGTSKARLYSSCSTVKLIGIISLFFLLPW